MNSNQITVYPTVSGNGFVKGHVYCFHHIANDLWRVDNGMERFENGDTLREGTPSPHLREPNDPDNMGHFVLV